MVMDNKKENLSFEEIIKKVEKTIDKLQSGDLDIDKSIDEFKEGLVLIKDAQDRLKSAKLRVQEVLKQDGEFKIEDIEG